MIERRLLGLELAACALAATVALTMLIIGVDALRFHVGALKTASPLSLLLAFQALTLLLTAGSLTRQIRRQRALLAKLPGTPRTIHGVRVRVIASDRPHAFCAGLLRPRVFVSHGVLDRLSERELHCVLAHEQHHARRRDPLRRALMKAVCDGFWFVPTLRATARTYAAVSELAADAVAIRSTGVAPLVSALAHFDQAAPRLAATEIRRPASALTRTVALSVLLALTGATLYLLRPVSAELCLPLSTALGAPLALLILALGCLPAGVLSHRATRELA